MTVTVHPDRGQPLADLSRALLAVADDPRDVRPVTGARSGYLVPAKLAHTYLSGRLDVQAATLSLLGVVPAASAPVAEPEPAPAVDAPDPDPLDVFVPPVVEPVPDFVSEAVPPKRGPGRPRKTAPPATTEEVP